MEKVEVRKVSDSFFEVTVSNGQGQLGYTVSAGMEQYIADLFYAAGDALLESDKGEELKKLREQYQDLLYQVVNKIPGETRHETARRIISQHETPSGNSECGQSAPPTEGER